MPVTKIIPIRCRLDRTLDYVVDENKTADLQNAVEYADDKTKNMQGFYVSAFNCTKDTAVADMNATKRKFGKSGRKILGYHLIQSFAPGETDPQTAHTLGVEFLQKSGIADKYEAVLSTHVDKQHLHNHIVFNSVSHVDGKMYRNNFKDYFGDIRGNSDRIAEEHGLSVIKHPEGKGEHYSQWQAEQQGKPSWRSIIRTDVDKAIKASLSWTPFINNLKKMGYEVKTNVKHVAVRPPGAVAFSQSPSTSSWFLGKPCGGGVSQIKDLDTTPKERWVRLRSLGENYTEYAIKQRIVEQFTAKPVPKHERTPAKKVAINGSFKLNKITFKSLRALYYHYLRKLRGAQNYPAKYPYIIKEDLSQFDRINAQTKFLIKYKIDTVEQLTEFKAGTVVKIETLTEKRTELYNEKRRAGTPPERVRDISVEIGVISKELKEYRNEVRLCDDIVERAQEIKAKNRAMYADMFVQQKTIEHRYDSRRSK